MALVVLVVAARKLEILFPMPAALVLKAPSHRVSRSRCMVLRQWAPAQDLVALGLLSIHHLIPLLLPRRRLSQLLNKVVDVVVVCLLRECRDCNKG